MLVYPKIINNLIIALVLICITACTTTKRVVQNTTIEELNPKLIFLNYTISENNKGKKNIQFINKIITDGKLKISSNEYIKSGITGDLICTQLDKNSNILQNITIKNPLVKIFEYVDDSKTFKTKKVELKNTEFSLKLKLEPNAQYISIYEIEKKLAQTKPLIKTKIN
ncbi:hypothetical protein [Jejuia spongiicola]|uniref:Lipoprotein n=1 Tax=Jejuia spongiicola TaxID=2942207 RepID=A0ABT0QI87_9FLAO|nr:hypothetical protein [Jejuia spongiicola]MCL6295660.1 hypothetical protein [Jejuia spongiicola]